MDDTAKAQLIVMGEITTKEPDGSEITVPMGLLLKFSSAEEIRKAIADGRCKFDFV